MLLSANAAVRVRSGEDLTEFVRCCLEESDYGHSLGQYAKAVVKVQQGATRRTWKLIEPLLDGPQSRPQSQRSAA
jgi:3-deoxy-D-manno-octulosonic-acid transferase